MEYPDAGPTPLLVAHDSEACNVAMSSSLISINDSLPPAWHYSAALLGVRIPGASSRSQMLATLVSVLQCGVFVYSVATTVLGTKGEYSTLVNNILTLVQSLLPLVFLHAFCRSEHVTGVKDGALCERKAGLVHEAGCRDLSPTTSFSQPRLSYS